VRRKISILGATGSVGKSTLDLVEHNPERFEIVALTAATSAEALADIARRTRAKLAVLADESRLEQLQALLAGTGCRAAAGEAALIDAALVDADVVIAAIVGCAGLRPVMAAVEAGATVALANKEALVTAGLLMTRAAQLSGATLLPIDSEHNAIFQCLAGSRAEDVSRIILTASGGPFRTALPEAIAGATPEQACAHPNWSMGAKISVDSATMMNKGLELIEARYLFGLPSNRIDVLIHSQSVVHSLVEFVDGSVLAQLGAPDMRIPISFALAWPERIATPAPRLDLAAISRLDFETPDLSRFPALRLARDALEAGGAAPIVLNAANEVAVAGFLGNRLRFPEIAEFVERTLDSADFSAPATIDEVLEIDRATRSRIDSLMTEACH
jgi:1-deoxy-D-xylulose-5-phosphate reductoisomerase